MRKKLEREKRIINQVEDVVGGSENGY